jgi:hypothetical protein
MNKKCERSTKKNSLPEPLELAVLAFLFITPWGMTVGIALISPMLSLTSCGLRMQDPILKQKKNINAIVSEESNQSRQPRQSSHPCKKIKNNNINTCTTQNRFEHKQPTKTTTTTTIVPGQTHSS